MPFQMVLPQICDGHQFDSRVWLLLQGFQLIGGDLQADDVARSEVGQLPQETAAEIATQMALDASGLEQVDQEAGAGTLAGCAGDQHQTTGSCFQEESQFTDDAGSPLLCEAQVAIVGGHCWIGHHEVSGGEVGFLMAAKAKLASDTFELRNPICEFLFRAQIGDEYLPALPGQIACGSRAPSEESQAHDQRALFRDSHFPPLVSLGSGWLGCEGSKPLLAPRRS